MGIEIRLERYDVQVLGSRFQFEGQMEPIGALLDYLNDENRSAFPMYDVTLFPIVAKGPLSRITRSQIVVNLNEVGLIFFRDPDYRQRVQRLRNMDRVIAYTPHAILRGNVHRVGETRLRNLFDMAAGVFLVMTDVSVFPLTELPAPFPQDADLLVVNRLFVNVIHRE